MIQCRLSVQIFINDSMYTKCSKTEATIRINDKLTNWFQKEP